MSPVNAKFVTDAIALFCLIIALLVFTDKIHLSKRPYFLDKYRRAFVIVTIIAILYPLYEVAAFIFGWDSMDQ
jgi:hypothetical protein